MSSYAFEVKDLIVSIEQKRDRRIKTLISIDERIENIINQLVGVGLDAKVTRTPDLDLGTVWTISIRDVSLEVSGSDLLDIIKEGTKDVDKHIEQLIKDALYNTLQSLL
ncbi:hypothetical protein KQR54_18205 [Mycobacterium gordonae]|nr:hypothetical protein [Mycobacterium gordonae]